MNDYQRLNNLGVVLLEEGRFSDARQCFVASLGALRKKSFFGKARRRSSKNECAEAVIWSANPDKKLESDDSTFIWMRGLRMVSPDSSPMQDMPGQFATVTFNGALCLHLLCTEGNPESLRWAVRAYSNVLKILEKTNNKRLKARILVAVYNNIANLHCQMLDYREAFRWYALLSRHLNGTDCHDDIVASDREGIVTNLLFCCNPHIAAAA